MARGNVRISLPHGATPSLARGSRGPQNTGRFAHRNTATPNASLNAHAAPNIAAPNAANTARDNMRDRFGRRGPASTVGQGAAAPNLAGGLRSRNQASAQSHILRNAALATLAPNDPAARSLARSTFRGRFAQSGWARGFDRDHRHHHFGLVLGFAGGLFWPYAYDDFVDYTFWPSAYDTFWPYAYDDVYQGLYGAYAPEYDEQYADAGAPATGRTYADVGAPNATGGAAQVCSTEAQGLTDFPIERIAQQVQPNQQQQGLLDQLKDANAKAVQAMQAACPGDLPATPTGRLAAMRIRVSAMLQAVQTVRPALDAFYQSLSDEQKERFNALDESNTDTTASTGAQPQAARDLAQLCGAHTSPTANLPIGRIRDQLKLSDTQNDDLQALDQASAKAADVLNASCPTAQTLTPTGRIAVMEQRLNAMLQAIETVRPALTRFYGSLSDEQKARFDRLGARPA